MAAEDAPIATEIVPVDAQHPEAAAIAQAAAVLHAGGRVAFPTETVYGLGAHALDESAVRGIFRAKGRPANNPLIVHVARVADARILAAEWPAAAAALAEQFWPGSLSLVVKKRPLVPDSVTGGGATVALRIPRHPVALALLAAAAIPIAAPSANRSNAVSPTRAEHVWTGLAGRIEMILDGGPTPGGLESTVLDLTTSPPRLLRPGLVTPAAIEAVIGPIARPAAIAPAGSIVPLPSPGMLQRHYAPRAPIHLLLGDGAATVDRLAGLGLRVGWLRCGAPRPGSAATVVIAELPPEPFRYAAGLYASLFDLDQAGVQAIVVELPGEAANADAWLAIRDRLQRAGAPAE